MKRSSALKTNVATAGNHSGAAPDHNDLQSDSKGFSILSGILKDRCGIDLPETPKNLSLMSSRLRKILMARGLSTYSEYAALINAGASGAMNEFISALTTNTTHFFREGEHFDHLKRVLPGIIESRNKSGQRELRVWCAASSTGQEPYTILITILESGALNPNWTIKFLATDIDLAVLEKATRAVYREDDLANVSPALRQKYFLSEKSKNDETFFRVKPQFTSMIRFARLNLIESAWPFQHQFDVIFCRNVLIYFDSPTAQGVIEHLASQLNPGGYLFIGHSECGHVKTRLVKPIAAAAYVRLAGIPTTGVQGK
jgi:chemotaxis protein methyltransferase CheR